MIPARMSTPQPKYRLVIEEIQDRDNKGQYQAPIEIVSIRLADPDIDAIVTCALRLPLPPTLAPLMERIKPHIPQPARDCDYSLKNPLGQCPHRNG